MCVFVGIFPYQKERQRLIFGTSSVSVRAFVKPADRCPRGMSAQDQEKKPPWQAFSVEKLA
jgi:hypothetical protein